MSLYVERDRTPEEMMQDELDAYVEMSECTWHHRLPADMKMQMQAMIDLANSRINPLMRQVTGKGIGDIVVTPWDSRFNRARIIGTYVAHGIPSAKIQFLKGDDTPSQITTDLSFKLVKHYQAIRTAEDNDADQVPDDLESSDSPRG